MITELQQSSAAIFLLVEREMEGGRGGGVEFLGLEYYCQDACQHVWLSQTLIVFT